MLRLFEIKNEKMSCNFRFVEGCRLKSEIIEIIIARMTTDNENIQENAILETIFHGCDNFL